MMVVLISFCLMGCEQKPLVVDLAPDIHPSLKRTSGKSRPQCNNKTYRDVLKCSEKKDAYIDRLLASEAAKAHHIRTRDKLENAKK